jgi:hypothetical protein
MAAYKEESYNLKERNILLSEESNKEMLRLKQVELKLFKEAVIKEYIELEKKKKFSVKKILNIFNTKK